MQKFIKQNWERILFVLIGMTFLAFSISGLYAGETPEASATFVMAFVSFVWSNLSRFKRFKGIGFEAELWEDKQKEAADLIDRLKNVVSNYTREIVLGQVRHMRFQEVSWKKNWDLYDELVAQHGVLGQKIDFSDLKKAMDDYFLFDMCMASLEAITRVINKAKGEADQAIQHQFGSPIQDAEGFGKEIKKLSSIKPSLDDPFLLSKKGNLADKLLQLAEAARTQLKEKFDINVIYDDKAIERLRQISKCYENRPVQVNDDLILLAQERAPFH